MQGKRMESLEAFKDARLLKNEQKNETKSVSIPKYEPKALGEVYKVGDIVIVLEHEERHVLISAESEDHNLCAVQSISYDAVPEFVQFLAWAMRERMEAAADVQAEQIQEQ